MVAEVAGFGDLNEYQGFGEPLDDFTKAVGTRLWPDGDPLVQLLTHSDCDGSIPWDECYAIAGELEELIPAMVRRDRRDGMMSDYEKSTRRFIDGLRDAASAQEDVEFH